MEAIASRLEATALRLEAISPVLGWRPSLVIGNRLEAIARAILSGWRPSLVGWRPPLLGSRPWAMANLVGGHRGGHRY